MQVKKPSKVGNVSQKSGLNIDAGRFYTYGGPNTISWVSFSPIEISFTQLPETSVCLHVCVCGVISVHRTNLYFGEIISLLCLVTIQRTIDIFSACKYIAL